MGFYMRDNGDIIDNEITIRNHKLQHHGDIKHPNLDKSIRVLRDYGLSLQGYQAITEYLEGRFSIEEC